MSTQNKKNAVSDYVVVGSGLSGLLVAQALAKEGAQVTMVDASEHDASLHRSVSTKLGSHDNALCFLPDTEQTRRGLEFLSTLIGETVSFESFERAPVTYESGGLRPFVGFGNNPPEFYDDLSYFLNQKELIPSLPISEWATKLMVDSKIDYTPRSFVTKFIYNEDKIQGVVINGQKTIQSLNVIYAGPIKALKYLLPEGAISTRARQKFSKAKFWTAVGVDLIHATPQSEELALHVLNGTTQDDLGPCVGRFFAPVQNEAGVMMQASQWLSFLDDDDAEDTEKIGAALKKIKRQIKRAYPNSLDGLVSERILAVPSFSGNGELKLTGHQTLPQANNFWIASGGVHTLQNLSGILAQAQIVTSALGVNPMGAELELSTELENSEQIESEESAID